MAALLTLFRHAARAEAPVPDRELLQRFAVGRDESAFAELVRRHGPVVYRICRRLVGASAADDAFQATFLVLATRVDAASAAGSVGGWLIGVASRVARQMRRAAGRRARHETAAAALHRSNEPEHPVDLADQFRALDEELARLPDRLRDPVVLCLLQGRTQEDAARELGRDARTLRRRLDRAKRVLRARLERRGVVPAVATGLIAASGSVSASVPSDLANRTVSTVFDFLTGGARRLAPVVLAKGVATSMFARKLTHLMALAAAGLIGVGVVLADDARPVPSPRATQAAPPALPVATPTPAPVAASAKKAAGAMDEERMIMIQALCIQAPAGLCERVGVAEEKDANPAWVLTRREARMLNALIRAEKEKGGLEILSRPQLICADNQSCSVQVGQDVPIVTKVETHEKDGTTIAKTTMDTRPVGTGIRVTPRSLPDGTILLSVGMQLTAMVPQPVNPGNGTTTPAFDIQSVTTTVLLEEGGTALIRGGIKIRNGDGKKSDELFWIITPQLLNALPAVQPRAKRPTPVAPPVPSAPPVQPQPLHFVPAPAAVPVNVPATGTPPPMPVPMLPPAPRP
jgi:RNA polymerase sigma factor (sigma-70 family)